VLVLVDADIVITRAFPRPIDLKDNLSQRDLELNSKRIENSGL
jgi:hypothetical protein